MYRFTEIICVGIIAFCISFVVATVGFSETRPVGLITEAAAAQEQLKPVRKIHPAELECLAKNIYFESNNQSKVGMIAVARVVMNRVLDTRFPNNVCDVIYEGPVKESWKTKQDPSLPEEDRTYFPRKHKCQFSWYCDGKPDDIPSRENNIAWRTAEDIAYQILVNDMYKGIVEGATHYHADYVNPAWNQTITLITHIDDHIFYRWD